MILCLENMKLLGKEDVGMATDDEQNLLRLLVPLSKLYSGKQVYGLNFHFILNASFSFLQTFLQNLI